MNTSESDRRNHSRHPISAVVGIDADSRKGRVGMTRNISASGLVFHSASRFKAGDELELKIRPPQQKNDHFVSATVVRTREEPLERGTFFPHITAVEFARPVTTFCKNAEVVSMLSK